MIVLRGVFVSVALVVFIQGGFAQKVNDRVRLESTNPLGIPVHPAAGDASYVRWDHGTEGVVTAIDSVTGWFRVEAGAETGWITKRYLVVLSEQEDDEDPA